MKKRKDSFWGIHCDYHAQPWMKTVGKHLREEDIRTICRELRPDYWQIDCKGHFGWTSYPTALGNAMPDFAQDTLALWRKVTREEGVALYLHYSGVWDEKYCAEHPQDRVLNADGTYNDKVTYRGSRYVDDLLIPQLSELAEKYEVDGIWLDGECWACKNDYHPETLAAFEEETGICLDGQIPVKRGDPYFEEYREYNRELFRRYVRYYVDVLHQKFPDLQITSNWIFSDHMPEPVTANVDFLSGDNLPFDSLHSARYASRYLAQQKMPWDLMGPAQRWNGEGHIDLLPVHPVQVMQQAACAISLGGGFQAANSFLFDGSPNKISLLNLKPVADFMREREPYCFKGTPIHQAAMLLSTYDRHREGDRLFARGDINGKRGLTALLCDCGQSMEIVGEHTLQGHYDDYPLLIVPEIIEDLSEQTVRDLLAYAEKGGALLLTGPKTCRIFAKAGAPFEVRAVEKVQPGGQFLGQRNDANDQRFFSIDGTAFGGVLYPVALHPTGDAETVAVMFDSVHSTREPLSVLATYGKGKIAAIGADIGTAYNTASQYLHRTMMKTIVEKLYVPLARIEKAGGLLELVCLEKDGRLMLQLLNANGGHNNISCDTEDFIPPVVDIRLSVAVDRVPKKVILQPQHRELPFEYRDGRVFFDLDRLDLHNVVEFIK